MCMYLAPYSFNVFKGLSMTHSWGAGLGKVLIAAKKKVSCECHFEFDVFQKLQSLTLWMWGILNIASSGLV